MYQYICGELTQIHATFLVVEVGGIFYQIFCANPFRWQESLKQSIKVFLELVVREDSMMLYGFKDQAEKDLFLMLNKVSGIGPKSALSILALDDHQGLVNAIDQADAKYLMKFPGVGKKTAQQMILDLQGKLSLDQTEKTKPTHDTDAIIEEVKQALLGLGYRVKEIDRILPQLKKEKFENSQAGLSFAFKLLIK